MAAETCCIGCMADQRSQLLMFKLSLAGTFQTALCDALITPFCTAAQENQQVEFMHMDSLQMMKACKASQE